MDHKTTMTLLGDAVSDRLSEADAQAVEAHVATCDECESVFATMQGVSHEVAAQGRALFTPHPTPDDLVSFAMGSPQLGPDRRTGVDAHVRACPSCTAEMALARDTDRHAHRAWWQSVVDVVTTRPSRAWAALGPACAALAILLAFPAYQGVMQVPALHGRVESARQQIATLENTTAGLRERLRIAQQSTIRPPATPTGGAARLLYLTGMHRGAGTPPVQYAPQQAFIPLALACDAQAAASRPSTAVQVRIVRQDTGTVAWTYAGRLGEVWDPSTQVVSLLVPAAALGTGEFRAEVRFGREREPGFTSSFTLTGAAPQ